MSCSKHQLFWTIEPREYLLWITNQNHKGSSISKGIFNLVPISNSLQLFNFWMIQICHLWYNGDIFILHFFQKFKERTRKWKNEYQPYSKGVKHSEIAKLRDINFVLRKFEVEIRFKKYLHRLNHLYRQFDFDYMMSKSCFKNEIWKLLFYTEIPGVSWIQDCGEIGAVSLKVTREVLLVKVVVI